MDCPAPPFPARIPSAHEIEAFVFVRAVVNGVSRFCRARDGSRIEFGPFVEQGLGPISFHFKGDVGSHRHSLRLRLENNVRGPTRSETDLIQPRLASTIRTAIARVPAHRVDAVWNAH